LSPYSVLLYCFRQVFCSEILSQPSKGSAGWNSHICHKPAMPVPGVIFFWHKYDYITFGWNFFTISSYPQSGLGKLWPVGEIQLPSVFFL
jgi:hypothetical protein